MNSRVCYSSPHGSIDAGESKTGDREHRGLVQWSMGERGGPGLNWTVKMTGMASLKLGDSGYSVKNVHLSGFLYFLLI